MKTKIIDAHVHLFPPAMIARRESLAQSDPWFAEAFGHPAARMRTAEDLIARMDAAGVDVCVAVGWPWSSQEHCAEHNSYHAEVATKYPDRIVWLGVINPVAEGWQSEIDRCVSLGAKGFGELNQDGQGFLWREPANLAPALEAIAATGLPLMCHTSETVGHLYPGKGLAHPSGLIRPIEAHPNLKWVLAHWGAGMPFYEMMPEIKKACANVAYDSAASSLLYDDAIFQSVAGMVGVEKVLFASDWPVLGQSRMIERVRNAGFSPDELNAILGGNAQRIYDIP